MPGSKFALILTLLRQSSSQLKLSSITTDFARSDHACTVEDARLRTQVVSRQVELLSPATVVLSGDW